MVSSPDPLTLYILLKGLEGGGGKDEMAAIGTGCMYVHLCVWPELRCNAACMGVRYEYLGRCSGPVSQV